MYMDQNRLPSPIMCDKSIAVVDLGTGAKGSSNDGEEEVEIVFECCSSSATSPPSSVKTKKTVSDLGHCSTNFPNFYDMFRSKMGMERQHGNLDNEATSSKMDINDRRNRLDNSRSDKAFYTEIRPLDRVASPCNVDFKNIPIADAELAATAVQLLEFTPPDIAFKNNEIVWVSYKGKLFWPAIVLDPEDWEGFESANDERWVFWFNYKRPFSKIKIRRIEKFNVNFRRMMRLYKARQSSFTEAVCQAVGIVLKRKVKSNELKNLDISQHPTIYLNNKEEWRPLMDKKMFNEIHRNYDDVSDHGSDEEKTSGAETSSNSNVPKSRFLIRMQQKRKLCEGKRGHRAKRHADDDSLLRLDSVAKKTVFDSGCRFYDQTEDDTSSVASSGFSLPDLTEVDDSCSPSQMKQLMMHKKSDHFKDGNTIRHLFSDN